MEGAINSVSNLPSSGNDNLRNKGKEILIEDDLVATFGNNKGRILLNLGGINDVKVGSGHGFSFKTNDDNCKLVGSGPISHTQESIGLGNFQGSSGLGLVNKADLGLKKIVGLGLKESASSTLKNSTDTSLKETEKLGFIENLIIEDKGRYSDESGFKGFGQYLV